MAEPIAATVRRVFVLSWLGRSSSSTTDACVSSFCASAGFSVCDSPRCEACDEVTIDGLSVELASVNGSFSAFSSLFCPGAMSFVLQGSHCCTLRCVRKTESLSYPTGGLPRGWYHFTTGYTTTISNPNLILTLTLTLLHPLYDPQSAFLLEATY